MTMTTTPVRIMRQSTLGSGLTCHRRLYYELVYDGPRERTTSESRIEGTGYHSGLEMYYKQGGDISAADMLDVIVRSMSAALQTEGADRVVWDTSFEEAVERNQMRVADYLDNKRGWDHSGHQVLGVEVQFRFPWIPGWDATGTIDLVLIGPDGWLRFVDHKTAGNKWREGKEHARQTVQGPWYDHWGKRWFVENIDPTPRPSEFYYDVASVTKARRVQHFERRFASYSPSQLAELMANARDLATLVDQGGPFLPNRDTNLCSHLYCDHWYICPSGEAFNRAHA
jgi:hypothetical protein